MALRTQLVAAVVAVGAVAAPARARSPKRADVVTATYHPGRWLRLHLPHHTRLSFRLILEPLLRYSHVVPPSGNAPDDTVDLIIRRGRVGFQVDADRGVGLRFEMSVKNMHSEIHNMYGYWRPSEHLELQAGFIKAPGGLERDTASFDQEFIERSIITYYNRDHEVGVMLAATTADARWRAAVAITRDPPALAGGDPEDSPQIPAGVEAEDLTRASSKWAAEARALAVPDKHLEVSVNGGVRLRPDEPDFGEIAVEPYDSTFLTNRPYRGVMVHVGADAGVAHAHWKVSGEVAFRRDGEQLAYPDGTVVSETPLGGHLTAEGGYLVGGWSPCGHFGAAVDAAPLRDGWALVARVMGQRIDPVDAAAATFGSVELGWHWVATPNLRVQVDLAVQRFGAADVTLLDENRGVTRLYGQTWAVFRL